MPRASPAASWSVLLCFAASTRGVGPEIATARRSSSLTSDVLPCMAVPRLRRMPFKVAQLRVGGTVAIQLVGLAAGGDPKLDGGPLPAPLGQGRRRHYRESGSLASAPVIERDRAVRPLPPRPAVIVP